VTFVLRPTWLPTGYSISGGGWISPSGGLRVYPNTGVSDAVLTAGSSKQRSVPILFTLNYYGYHDPESKDITLTASPAKSPGAGTPRPNTKLGRRRVNVYTYTQGALRNLNVDIEWVEGDDSMVVTTQGLPTAQAEHFVEGLTRERPPRSHPLGPATTTTSPPN